MVVQEPVQLSHVWDVFRDEAEKIDIKDLRIIGKNLKTLFCPLTCASPVRGVAPGCCLRLGAAQAGACERNPLGTCRQWGSNRGASIGWERFITVKEDIRDVSFEGNTQVLTRCESDGYAAASDATNTPVLPWKAA